MHIGCIKSYNTNGIIRSFYCFFVCFCIADWNTLLADIKFSIYPPRIEFSDFNFKFSSFTFNKKFFKKSCKKI